MKYIIFGLGAIGSNLLLQIANMNPKDEFIGIDYDKVEERNIATQAYFLTQCGIPKAHVLNVTLGLKLRNLIYTPVVKKIITKDDELIVTYKNQTDVIMLDCFDNTKSRRLLEGIDNCLHIGFSPKYTAEIIWGSDYTAPDDIKPEENDICDIPEAIPFINFVVSMATFSIKNYIDTKKKNNFLIVNKFNIRKLN